MLREQLARALAWKEAHATFDDAVSDLAPELHGRRATGFPHSPWELVEHLRLAQHDLLDFCRNAKYRAPKWPEDYWPSDPAPPSNAAWDRSIAQYRRDRSEFEAFTRDTAVDLDARIPHGDGQTYGREILLAIDHAAYHVGQLVAVRQALGAWINR